jgi:predicted SAM-dependent methyltransferase
MDYFKEQGSSTTGMDISNHSSKHNFINSDFEKFISEKKYDIIYASHVFEHFIDPIAQLKRCKSMLNSGGLIYIAMPDTYMIDFANPTQWDWNCDEHYILWSMESFIELAEELGFKCVYSEHSQDLYKREDDTWFWKQDFKVILKCE